MALFKNLKKAFESADEATTLKLTVKTQELPEELSALRNLDTLYIQSKTLNTLPDWICEFPKLRVLYINCSELSDLNVKIFNLPALERISNIISV